MTKLVPVSAVIWSRVPCLPGQDPSPFSPLLLWLLQTEEIQAPDPGFEPQQTPQSAGTRKKAPLPFKVAGLSLVYKYMRYKLYIYIPREGQSVLWGKIKALEKCRKNDKREHRGAGPEDTCFL